MLGFTVLYQMDGMGWCEPSTSVARVNMGLWQVERPEGKGGATLTFGVTYIDAARKELERKSVRFDGPTQTIESINVKPVTFFDPDGNHLMLHQDLQKQ